MRTGDRRGPGGKHISAQMPRDHVSGYTIGHNVSAPTGSLRARPSNGWPARRSSTLRSPTGQRLVTPDEVPDPQISVSGCGLSGRRCKTPAPAGSLFGVDELIAYLSQIVTLKRREPHFHGNPTPGVGIAHKPPSGSSRAMSSRSDRPSWRPARSRDGREQGAGCERVAEASDSGHRGE